jgi:hypothetical protein
MKPKSLRHLVLLLAAILLGWFLGRITPSGEERPGETLPVSVSPVQESLPSNVDALFGRLSADPTPERQVPVGSEPEASETSSSAPRVTDEGLATCASALERLFSPNGRRISNSRTDLDRLLDDRVVNPFGIVPDAKERLALEAIAAEWDPQVEDAWFFQTVEKWRGIETALSTGRYRTWPHGKGWTPSDFFAEFGEDIWVTSISGPTAGVGEPRRIIVQNATTNPAMFRAKAEADRLRAERSRAFTEYFASLHAARQK